MNRRRFVIAGWLTSLFASPAAPAAKDPTPAELLSRIMPPPTPAIGFDDPRSLADFARRSAKEKDVAVRALGLSNLGAADINGDHCLTGHEYSLYLAMWKRWNASPRANRVQAIEDYRFDDAKMTDEVMSYATRLLRRSTSVGEMQLLKRRILVSDENKNKSIDLDELQRFEEIWNSYLRLPYAAVKSHLDSMLGAVGQCAAAPTRTTELDSNLQPLLRAQEVATELQKLLPRVTSYDQLEGKAGVAAFYAELYRQTRQDDYLKQALAVMEDAVNAYRKSGSHSNSLLVGSTGLAFSALSAYRSSGEKRFLEIAELLAADIGAPRDNEYGFGAAGIGIFMLNLAQTTSSAVWRDKAVEMASYLAKTAVRANGKAKWKFDAQGMFTVGFGHGVAGIGYFFSHLYRATHDPLHKTLAIEAGNYVLSLADRDASGGYHWAIFDPMFRFGNSYQWSHGSAGIGHLFIALDAIDPNRRWKAGLAGSIASTLREGPTVRSTDGMQCCGRSGQGELLIEAYYSTRKEAYLQEALRFGAMLLADGKPRLTDDSGPPYAVGYNLGLAGIGYYFLRLSSPLTVDLPFQVYVRPPP